MIKVEHHMLRFITVVIFILRGIASGQNASETIPWLAPESFAVLVAAHRGGYETDKADRAPENSVANVEMAIQKGYDVFETDIQRTADGMFVIVHDATIERELTGTGAANTLTLAELKKLKKRYRDVMLPTLEWVIIVIYPDQGLNSLLSIGSENLERRTSFWSY